MISRSLQRDLKLGHKKNRCRQSGGCVYGKPFIRGKFAKAKCKQCRQEIVLGKYEYEKFKNKDYVVK